MYRVASGTLAALLIGAGASLAQPAIETLPLDGAEGAVTVAPKDPVDALYEALAMAEGPEAEKIAGEIQSHWARSGSDSMDLLLQRGRGAMAERDYRKARAHLSALTRLAPDFAEGWNAAATLAYLEEDYWRAAGALEYALSLNPRNFSALTGLAFVLERTGNEKGALAAWRRVKQLYPAFERADEAIGRLAPDIDGQAL